jgi:hypothetical protein
MLAKFHRAGIEANESLAYMTPHFEGIQMRDLECPKMAAALVTEPGTVSAGGRPSTKGLVGDRVVSGIETTILRVNADRMLF